MMSCCLAFRLYWCQITSHFRLTQSLVNLNPSPPAESQPPTWHRHMWTRSQETPRVNAMSGPHRKTLEWLMSVLLLGASHSDPFLRKQIASSIFKTKTSALSSSSEWFRMQTSGSRGPLLRGGKQMVCGWFSVFLFFFFLTQFHFRGPIPWVRFHEDVWEVGADMQTHSLHTALGQWQQRVW